MSLLNSNNFYIVILNDIFSYEFFFADIIRKSIPNNYSKYKSMFKCQNFILPAFQINFSIVKELGSSQLALIITEYLFTAHAKSSVGAMNLKKALLLSNKNLYNIAIKNNIHIKNEKENANFIKIIVGMIFLDQMYRKTIFVI